MQPRKFHSPYAFSVTVLFLRVGQKRSKIGENWPKNDQNTSKEFKTAQKKLKVAFFYVSKILKLTFRAEGE